MKSNDLRKLFLDFFISKNHKLVKSGSLVPQNDPTLLFTNAGMVQFKDIFTGKQKPDFTRATTSQKCVRAGGKHNDLDNVGFTTRHHTFFEMLGNFSFGDYFKEQAISYAWEFVSKQLNLPKDKLYFTIYETDDEARKLWKKIASVGDDRVIGLKENIWSMGATGPCGSCTEIFYDKGDKIFGGLPGTKDEDGDRYIEIWNNVFMENEMFEDGHTEPLKNKNIDTGMGLERISSVMQGVNSNFDIDIFRDLINNISDILNVKTTIENRPSFNIIADHLRATSFLIADGVIPSNEGRGYVLRRIMRRALRHINILGAKGLYFNEMVTGLGNIMGTSYPELISNKEFIKSTILNEEEGFATTLDAGLKILQDEVKKSQSKILSGEVAFKLYDTYGFPLDLTEDILKKENIKVDKDSFDQAMQKQRENSKSNNKFKGDAGNSKMFYEMLEKYGETKFVGYDETHIDATILNIFSDDENNTWIVFDTTCFYAQSGGQIGDTGFVNDKIAVLDTQKPLPNLFIHKISANAGLNIGDRVKLAVDEKRRFVIAKNHSTAHLLQRALKQVVGEHVAQRGSWVGDTGLRFDFLNPKGVSPFELEQIELLVNKLIEDSLPIVVNEMPIKKAQEMGAIALFDDKYGDVVRVVNMGNTSIELCGGTHLANTNDAKFFKIETEESISAGVRRITAITGDKAIDFAKSLGCDTNLPPTQLIKCVHKKLIENKVKEEELKSHEQLRKKQAEEQTQATDIKIGLANVKLETVGNINLATLISDTILGKNLKPIADAIRAQNTKTIVMLITNNDDKVSVIIALTQDLISKFSAIDLIKIATPILGGQGGGGRPDMAQAGGTKPQNAIDAINEIKNLIGDK